MRMRFMLQARIIQRRATPPMPSPSLSGCRLLLAVAVVASLSTAATTFASVDCQASPSSVNSTFRSNVAALLDSLPSAAARTGFASLSRGAFVRGICRGDSAPGDCAACLRTGASDIYNSCNSSVRAAGWYDKCFVTFADTNASNSHEDTFRQILYNVNEVSDNDKDDFTAAYYKLMNRLAKRVVNPGTGTGTGTGTAMFATGEAVYDSNAPNGTMYGLLQCMRDRSEAECAQCLQDSMPQLPRCCYGNQGGVVLGYNCILRVEIYTYYDLALDAPLLPPPPATPLAPAPPLALAPSSLIGELHGKKRASTALVVALPVGAVLVAVIVLVALLLLKIRKPNRENTLLPADNDLEEKGSGYIAPEQLNITALRAATNNFSVANKLGEGGFGEVYKGTLPGGEEIAVKRLSRHSSQGFSELKNELVLAAKLKHRNLVQLLGVCLQEENKLLIYEYLPNRSLDTFLFDAVRRQQLDWNKRFAIICGIARGLLYLHEESRLKVIHRDLKPSNVLLDAEMNPKISDFGLARAFGGDQSRDITKRPVGTLGYMSPEYAYYGCVSNKSDMFSFGMIVLEMVTGRRTNISTYESPESLSLLSYVWRKWRTGLTIDVVDPSLAGQYPEDEVLNCVQVGLLCVQENPADRPDASMVALMLSSHSTTHERHRRPSRPAFVFGSIHSHTQGHLQAAWRMEGSQLIGNRQPSPEPISENMVTISELLPR